MAGLSVSYPSEDDEELDDEEWARVREQVRL
jgi:hypothetical protein